MNDRYLYRAKRKNWRELPKEMWWVEGYLFDDGFENGRMFVGGIVIEEYHGTACDDWIITGINFYEVETSTICQCTGLKDKNGKLIWENDIVKHDFGKEQIGVQLAIVKYDSKYACYQIKPIYDWMYCDKSDCEVIGNIFDNPELLEVGE